MAISEQHGVVTRRQLAEVGIDRWRVRNKVGAQRWQLAGRTVVTHNGPLTREQQMAAAVLSQPTPSALAGRAALEWWGLRGFEPRSIDVIVANGSRTHRMSGVAVHESRHFLAADSVQVRGLPCVSGAAAVLQAVDWESSPRAACGLALSAVQQRKATAVAVQEALAGRRLRHGKLLRAVMVDAAGGADSLAEIDFGKIARRAGLPPPIRQSVRLDANGARRYLDADFGRFAVEVDGGLHARVINAWADMARQNDLVIGGDKILRFPAYLVRSDPQLVASYLRLAWDRLGPP